MPRLIRSLLCKRVITDRETNDVTYVDCVESLMPKRLPAPLPQLYLATLWKSDESGEQPRLRVAIVGPGSHKPYHHEFPPIIIKPEHKSHRININLQGAPINQHGEHHIRVEVRPQEAKRWTRVAEIPLEVVEAPQDGNESAETQA